jgi:hypothetical protein
LKKDLKNIPKKSEKIFRKSQFRFPSFDAATVNCIVVSPAAVTKVLKEFPPVTAVWIELSGSHHSRRLSWTGLNKMTTANEWKMNQLDFRFADDEDAEDIKTLVG